MINPFNNPTKNQRLSALLRRRPAIVLAALLFSAASLAAQAPAQAPSATPASSATLIRNATILTVTHGTIEHGSILIENGKIAAVGTGVSAPAGATVIDASGQFVMPGIVDCHSHIAIDGNVNEGSISVSSMARIPDVLNPDDINIYRDLSGGVTTANILHGSANPIGGQTVVIKLRWGKPASELPFEGALPGIKFALGENPKRSNFPLPPGVPVRYPASRLGVEEVIRQAFIEAREYKKQWDDYHRRVAAGERDLIAPRRDESLEPLVEVLEGKRYVHAHCYRADEILMLARVASEFGFKIRTYQHVLEGYKIADEIAASGAGASTFSDWWAYKMEAFDAIPYNAALLTERGVIVSVNSDDAEEARHLNQEAAKSMKYGGLSANDALKLVTLNPAIQLGIDQRVGSIDTGKDADLVIYNHDPLSVYAVVQKTLIDGHVYFDRQLDLDGRAALEKEKQDLLAAEKKAAEPETKPAEPPAKKTGKKRPKETAAAVSAASAQSDSALAGGAR
jgi:imidazolonepropionase-like amidohydrolase